MQHISCEDKQSSTRTITLDSRLSRVLQKRLLARPDFVTSRRVGRTRAAILGRVQIFEVFQVALEQIVTPQLHRRRQALVLLRWERSAPVMVRSACFVGIKRYNGRKRTHMNMNMLTPYQIEAKARVVDDSLNVNVLHAFEAREVVLASSHALQHVRFHRRAVLGDHRGEVSGERLRRL